MRKHIPTYYTTPPDPKKCRYFNPNGPTPCHHPHCNCFSNWKKPEGCHCEKYSDRCFEQCEPMLYGSDVKTSPGAAVLALIVSVIAVAFLYWAGPARGATAQSFPEEDVWACYGGARYEAMSSGKPQCNELPSYCKAFTLMDHSCIAARLYVKMYGKEEAERRARACGASDHDIAEAKACLTEHGE